MEAECIANLENKEFQNYKYEVFGSVYQVYLQPCHKYALICVQRILH